MYQILLASLLLVACSSTRRSVSSADSALESLKRDSSLVNAHLGMMIAEAESGKVLAAYNEHRYFVPASNTKLWTMYAGIKYLGDSLVAGWVQPLNDSTVLFRSNGDPTFLHPDYKRQPLAAVLQQYQQVLWQNAAMRTTEYGNGWSWNDYDAAYMAPRSSLPMFGNVATFSVKNGKVVTEPSVSRTMVANAETFSDSAFSITRKFDDALFTIKKGIAQSITTSIFLSPGSNEKLAAAYFGNTWRSVASTSALPTHTAIHSQPADSLLRPLMHRSDNFFAEQTLLMLSNQWFGNMNEQVVIDSLLKTDLHELPDKPRWVDGSGLSRYNLFSPADYIWLLDKMQREFPMDRIKDLLPTGNDGTLTNYYKALEGKLFAKTGTLSGVVALSGYLYGKSGKLLLFSTIINNHNGSAPAVRRAVEKYLLTVWDKN